MAGTTSESSATAGDVTPGRSSPLAVRRIVVPLDMSALAEKAIDAARFLARAWQAEVVLLRVLDATAQQRRVPDPLDWEQERAAGHAYLDNVSARFMADDIRVQAEVAEGCPASEIVRFARASESDLVVLTTHGFGHGTDWAIGSTARKVIERAPCSVLLVPCDWEGHDEGPRRVLIPVDTSSRAECVLPLAFRLAALGPCQVVFAHVVRLPDVSARITRSEEERDLAVELTRRNREHAEHYLASLRDRLRHEGVEIDTVCVVGESPAMALVDLVEQRSTDLLVFAAHGQGHAHDYRFGSVAAQLVANPRCPTMVVLDRQERTRPPRWSGTPVAVREREGPHHGDVARG